MPEQVRILVFSASPYMRYVISGELSPESDLYVVGTARTPDELVHKRLMLRPDLVVVDLASPQELAELRNSSLPTELPVVAVCAHNRDGAELAFAALEGGVADVVARANGNGGAVSFRPDLLYKIRGIAQVRPERGPWQWTDALPREKRASGAFSDADWLVVIVANTGGLRPIVQLLAALPATLPASLLVLSALPTPYLCWFLHQVDPTTPFHLHLAQDGEALHTGVVHCPPCESPLVVNSGARLALSPTLPRGGCHPMADAVLASVAQQYTPRLLTLFLSGIGQDGVQGAREVHQAGGTVLVQDPATCAAQATPLAVIQTGAASDVLTPDELAAGLVARVGSG